MSAGVVWCPDALSRGLRHEWTACHPSRRAGDDHRTSRRPGGLRSRGGDRCRAPRAARRRPGARDAGPARPVDRHLGLRRDARAAAPRDADRALPRDAGRAAGGRDDSDCDRHASREHGGGARTDARPRDPESLSRDQSRRAGRLDAPACRPHIDRRPGVPQPFLDWRRRAHHHRLCRAAFLRRLQRRTEDGRARPGGAGHGDDTPRCRSHRASPRRLGHHRGQSDS